MPEKTSDRMAMGDADRPKTAAVETGAGGTARLVAEWREIAVALAFVAVPAAMTLMALQFNVEARRLPLLVGVPLTVLATLNLMVQLRRILAGGPAPEPQGGGLVPDLPHGRAGESRPPQSPPATEEPPSEALSLPAALLAFVGFCVLLFAVGHILATLLFTLVFLRVVGRHPWMRAVLVSAALSGTLYVVSSVLDIETYGGLLAGFLP
jgi:hypothetical protein